MKDAGILDALEEVLAAWQAPSIEGLAATLHQDFVAVGHEEGLFVRANGQTFLSYATRTAFHEAARTTVKWCDVHGRLAAACLTHEMPGKMRTTVVTMLNSSQGWRVVTAAFAVIDATHLPNEAKA
jgi:uncharacterized protein (DUF1501 family)